MGVKKDMKLIIRDAMSGMETSIAFQEEGSMTGIHIPAHNYLVCRRGNDTIVLRYNGEK